MEKISLIVVFLLGGFWEAEALSKTGVSGEDITITCSHSNAFSNIKYFCKGACNDKDVLISSRKKNTNSNKKYSIDDKGNTFLVTIFDLTEQDAGTYYCGIDRIGFDTYNQVVLTVKAAENPQKLPRSYSDGTLNITSKKKLVYIGAGLGVVVLALAVLLLIYFRHRRRGIIASSGNSQEKGQGTVYATLANLKQDADTATSSSNTDKAQQRGETSKDLTESVYSNVSNSSNPQTKPDGLLYATISFNSHTDCSSVTPRTAAVTYSTIEYNPPDQSTVYSNV